MIQPGPGGAAYWDPTVDPHARVGAAACRNLEVARQKTSRHSVPHAVDPGFRPYNKDPIEAHFEEYELEHCFIGAEFGPKGTSLESKVFLTPLYA